MAFSESIKDSGQFVGANQSGTGASLPGTTTDGAGFQTLTACDRVVPGGAPNSVQEVPKPNEDDAQHERGDCQQAHCCYLVSDAATPCEKLENEDHD